MITRSDFLDSIRTETAICTHLFSKIPSGAFDYRPTDGQRSMLELMQFLSCCVVVPLESMLEEDFSIAGPKIKARASMTAEQFCTDMDAQLVRVEELVEAIPEDDFLNRTVPVPAGGSSKLGPALINFPLKFITAYRMQLFLYVKANGVSDISTMNCWFGMDAPQK